MKWVVGNDDLGEIGIEIGMDGLVGEVEGFFDVFKDIGWVVVFVV